VNVASFKNVDEEKLLEIPGVVYVPMVGKVTVAMLERNLMRLYENFHSESSKHKATAGAAAATMLSQQHQSLWRLQIFTATVVTVLLALQLVRK
jgi:methylenetetrahydrofolate dehydrogenase (NAD+)